MEITSGRVLGLGEALGDALASTHNAGPSEMGCIGSGSPCSGNMKKPCDSIRHDCPARVDGSLGEPSKISPNGNVYSMTYAWPQAA